MIRRQAGRLITETGTAMDEFSFRVVLKLSRHHEGPVQLLLGTDTMVLVSGASSGKENHDYCRVQWISDMTAFLWHPPDPLKVMSPLNLMCVLVLGFPLFLQNTPYKS